MPYAPTIGMIYERGPKGSAHYGDEIRFPRFNLEWLGVGRGNRGTGNHCGNH
jgi:hypothetical protein